MPDPLGLFIVMFSKLSTKFYVMAHNIPDAHLRALTFAKVHMMEQHQDVVMVKAVVDFDVIITDDDYQSAKASSDLQSTPTKG